MSIEAAILKLAESQNKTNALIETRMNRPGAVVRGVSAVGRGVGSVATAPYRGAMAAGRAATAPFRLAASTAANIATAPYRIAAGAGRIAGDIATAPFRAVGAAAGGIFGGGTAKSINKLTDIVAKESTQKALLEQVELFRSDYLAEMKRRRQDNLDALEAGREGTSGRGRFAAGAIVGSDLSAGAPGGPKIPGLGKIAAAFAGLAASVVAAKKVLDKFKADADKKPEKIDTKSSDARDNAKRTAAVNARSRLQAARQASANLDETPFDEAANKNSALAQRKRIANAYGQMGADRAEGARIARIANAYGQMGADRAEGARIAIAEGRVPANLNEIPEPEVKPSKTKVVATTAAKNLGKFFSTAGKVAGPPGLVIEGAAAFGDKKNTELGSTFLEKLPVNLLAIAPFLADLGATGINYAAGTDLSTDMTSRFRNYSLEKLRNLQEATTGSAYFGQMEGARERAIRFDQAPIIGDGSKPFAYEGLQAQKEREARELENAIEDARRTSYLTGLSQLGINRRKTSLSNIVESLRFATTGGSGQLRKLRRELGLKEGTDFTTDFVGKKDASGKLTGEGASRIILTEAGVEKLRNAQGDKLQELQQFIAQMVTNKSVSQNPIVDASSKVMNSNQSNTTVLSGGAPSTVDLYDNLF